MEIKEFQVRIFNIAINYAKAGTGPEALICIPGGGGSWRLEFQEQLKNLAGDKFTVYCVEPPGLGKSRPPDRDYRSFTDIAQNDVKFVQGFMEELQLPPSTILGFSEGGRTALHLAFEAPSLVKKLVLWGTRSTICDKDVKIFKFLYEFDDWQPEFQEKFIKEYGKEYFSKLWSEQCDWVFRMAENGGKLPCDDFLPKITAPTLILHGNRDALTTPAHPKHLLEQIPNSRLLKTDAAGHNIQIDTPDWFNENVTKFVLQ